MIPMEVNFNLRQSDTGANKLHRAQQDVMVGGFFHFCCLLLQSGTFLVRYWSDLLRNSKRQMCLNVSSYIAMSSNMLSGKWKYLLCILQ